MCNNKLYFCGNSSVCKKFNCNKVNLGTVIRKILFSFLGITHMLRLQSNIKLKIDKIEIIISLEMKVFALFGCAAFAQEVFTEAELTTEAVIETTTENPVSI